MAIEKINENLFQIDTLMSGRAGYTSVFLVRGERAAILDAGVSINARTILQAVESAGVALDEIACIAITHAHYDHAGGAHELLRILHEKGNSDVKIACSIKPSIYLSRADICEKLMRSGTATEGDMAGDMLAINKEFFTVLEDGDSIDLGGITIRALATPGHANGHLAFHVPEIDFLYAGDACGLLARSDDGSSTIAPTAFAPEYKHKTYIKTLRMIADFPARLIGFAHFGVVENPADALAHALETTEMTRTMVIEMLEDKRTRDGVLDELEAKFGNHFASLYPDRGRRMLMLKSLIAGHVNELKKK